MAGQEAPPTKTEKPPQQGECVCGCLLCLLLPPILVLGASWLSLTPAWQNIASQSLQDNLLHSHLLEESVSHLLVIIF